MTPKHFIARGGRQNKQPVKTPVVAKEEKREEKKKTPSTKLKKLSEFNPSDPASADSNLFGLPFTPEEADIVVVPVPWDVTVSYGEGTATAPEHILKASRQVDLNDPDFPDLWRVGIAMTEIPSEVSKKSEALRSKASKYLDLLVDGKADPKKKEVKEVLDAVNKGSKDLNKWVKDSALEYIREGKRVGVIGGDHSTPLGLIEALGSRYDRFGILQIDAHMDLRVAYEGFEFSHASIMHNALAIKSVTKLVQVGVRDYCAEEANAVQEGRGRIVVHSDAVIRQRGFEGINFQGVCDMIVKDLPKHVYVSFDIDGLNPSLCPGTGTPVPGGLSFQEVMYLLRTLVRSEREIIGFDLCEVAPSKDSEWDANVGARVLYKLCGYMHKSLNDHR